MWSLDLWQIACVVLQEQAERDHQAKQARQADKPAAPAKKAPASATVARLSVGTPDVGTGAPVPAPIDRDEEAQRMERIKQQRLAVQAQNRQEVRSTQSNLRCVWFMALI